MRARSTMIALAVAIFLTACGGGDSESGTNGDVGEDLAAQAASGDLLFASDFEQVCRGIPQERGTAYGTATGVAPTVAFEGTDPEYRQSFGSIPDEWVPGFGDEAATELVVCMNRVDATSVQICDGFEDEGTEWSVETFDATYEVTIREATTATELSSTTVEAASERCPFISSYSPGDPNPKPSYARADDAVEAFVAEHAVG